MLDSRNQEPIDHMPILDPITTSNYTYNNNTYQLFNFAPTNDNGVEDMSQQHVDLVDVDQSGVSSPPLWKNTSSRSHDPSFQNSINHRLNSPSLRALAIAQGQWELMEMVKNMPESCYELSLKDLVEKNDQEQCLINKEEGSFTSTNDHQEQVVQQRVRSIKRQESSNMNGDQKKRKESFEDKGSFLKVFFPIPPKVKNSTKTSGTKVSPKVLAEGGTDKSEKDWWKKRFSCSSESDSSKTGSSSNSESTGRSGSSGSNDSRTSTKRFVKTDSRHLVFRAEPTDSVVSLPLDSS
ncbi:putative serine/threonine-protein kinase RIO1-like [Capsicum annuum]|nr:putative serine/threonine-protein kinase RIO1-like [Capsicum annuum]